MARPKKQAASASPPAPQKKVVKKTKDASAPKRALSAYFIWLGENRAEYPKAKDAGAAWRKLDDKSEWEKKAPDDKKRYDKELAAYNEANGDDEE